MAQVKHTDKKFYVGDSAENYDALMTYVTNGNDSITIDHTEVDDALEGQGIGTQLVEAAANYARENNLKVQATCPFAKSILEKKSEFQDVYEK